eukprot:NODE_3146_length_2084_cov_3.035769.p1 GENE.NODE_3146_length_2084_cov_3.035769~~NODE_3146_length_2084_cov_3.035769.p1  ORF type:complete len:557 (-),score=78.54 NODE_3146_length_2084_cov_3.035769:265-1935(-)
MDIGDICIAVATQNLRVEDESHGMGLDMLGNTAQVDGGCPPGDMDGRISTAGVHGRHARRARCMVKDAWGKKFSCGRPIPQAQLVNEDPRKAVLAAHGLSLPSAATAAILSPFALPLTGAFAASSSSMQPRYHEASLMVTGQAQGQVHTSDRSTMQPHSNVQRSSEHRSRKKRHWEAQAYAQPPLINITEQRSDVVVMDKGMPPAEVVVPIRMPATAPALMPAPSARMAPPPPPSAWIPAPPPPPSIAYCTSPAIDKPLMEFVAPPAYVGPMHPMEPPHEDVAYINTPPRTIRGDHLPFMTAEPNPGTHHHTEPIDKLLDHGVLEAPHVELTAPCTQPPAYRLPPAYAHHHPPLRSISEVGDDPHGGYTGPSPLTSLGAAAMPCTTPVGLRMTPVVLRHLLQLHNFGVSGREDALLPVPPFHLPYHLYHQAGNFRGLVNLTPRASRPTDEPPNNHWRCSVKNSFLHVELTDDSDDTYDGTCSQRSSSVSSRLDYEEPTEERNPGHPEGNGPEGNGPDEAMPGNMGQPPEIIGTSSTGSVWLARPLLWPLAPDNGNA